MNFKTASKEEDLKVGVLIEEKDITDLNAGIATTTNMDIKTICCNHLQGSNNHLFALKTKLGK